MKHATGPRRGRPRGNGKRFSPGGGKNQTFESSGPDVKIRGSAQQVYEKYLSLARDALSAGDRVGAEGFFQFADHYFRIVNANNGNGQMRPDQRPNRIPPPPESAAGQMPVDDGTVGPAEEAGVGGRPEEPPAPPQADESRFAAPIEEPVFSSRSADARAHGQEGNRRRYEEDNGGRQQDQRWRDDERRQREDRRGREVENHARRAESDLPLPPRYQRFADIVADAAPAAQAEELAEALARASQSPRIADSGPRAAPEPEPVAAPTVAPRSEMTPEPESVPVPAPQSEMALEAETQAAAAAAPETAAETNDGLGRRPRRHTTLGLGGRRSLRQRALEMGEPLPEPDAAEQPAPAAQPEERTVRRKPRRTTVTVKGHSPIG